MRRWRAALPPAAQLRRGGVLCTCRLLLLPLPRMGVTLLLVLLARTRVTLLVLVLLLFQLVATALLLLLAVHLRCCCLGSMASSAKGQVRVSGTYTPTQCTPPPSCTAALQRLSSPWPSASAEQRGCNTHAPDVAAMGLHASA